MESALDNGDFPLYVSLNNQFHFAIYSVADNDTLLSLIEALWLRMTPVVAFNLTIADHAADRFDQSSRAHHVEILNALRSGDPDRATAELQADLMHPAGSSENWESAALLEKSSPTTRKRQLNTPISQP